MLSGTLSSNWELYNSSNATDVDQAPKTLQPFKTLEDRTGDRFQQDFNHFS